MTLWFDTYPSQDIIGFMTPQEITFNTSQLKVMGLFYAEDKITSQKQTSITGTFFSNYFDMGKNVPSIYQVPATAHNLPPGIIGGTSILVVSSSGWQEL